MQYTDRYSSPLGEVLLTSDGENLTGLRFEERSSLSTDRADLPVFEQTRQWLDCYFSGCKPPFTPPLRLEGTDFQRTVWMCLEKIPYGQTTTYGAIAQELSQNSSARAVGGAVGRNPILIIVPCHRAIRADGSLGGYAGGIERKIALLELEGAPVQKCFT